jgi:hypothetical protein
MYFGNRLESPKKLLKKRNKSPNPILHETRGFTYAHIKKAVFSVIENPFFWDSFFHWATFCGFSCGARSR